MSDTRLLAVKTLIEVLSGEARPKKAVDLLSRPLDKRERAFLMEIVYGVLRFRDTLDWILSHFLKDPAKAGDFTLNNLRTALYQIYFMRVPDWAVVNESVEVEKASSSAVSGSKPQLVNAVLRNLLRQKARFEIPIRCEDPLSDIAINTSHPKWLVKRWIRRFGEDGARRLAEANNRIPPMTIRVNSLRTTREGLLSLLADHAVEAAPTEFSPDGITLREVRSHNELAFAHGLFAVQDEASQLITYLLDPKPKEKVLDACAAPGGKTTHIAELMGDSGEITAVEKDGKRIALLRDNIGTHGIRSVIIINQDIGELRGEGPFDRILLDAPCSATGVIRRNPDIKYRRRAKDLGEYRAKQIQLLQAASRLLKEGGRLVYSVCSIEPEEGEQVVNELLKTSGEFRIIDAEAPFLKSFIHEGFLRTYPHLHNMDGFFGVALCRKK
jgi:16S rRNA (cytosine967-C5)-methyltransferase